MIRDPSDGSVKNSQGPRAVTHTATSSVEKAGNDCRPLRPTTDQNWGLKSLDREARKPKPAPTIPELEQHYATHTLGRKPKEQE